MSTPAVDLRSDTVTRPTPAMRRAMAEAQVGDDVYGEDPTVRRLESLAAALMGKEAGLYVPSGTMANQLAVRVLASPATEALCLPGAHVYRNEAAASAVNSGVQMRPVRDVDGILAPDVVTAALPSVSHEGPPVSLLCLENTYMRASGRPWSAGEVRSVATAARDGGAAIHCDGARIWNASIALGEAPSDLAATVDTVMFCVSKGLGAPVGSLLCGSAEVIAEARAHRQRFGGAMRQAGIIAAAGIVALETMVERLADDHQRARRLADALADRFPGSLDPATVRTNIVCARADALPSDALDRLAARGVLAGRLDAWTLRFVTHHDVDDEGLGLAIEALDALAAAP